MIMKPQEKATTEIPEAWIFFFTTNTHSLLEYAVVVSTEQIKVQSYFYTVRWPQSASTLLDGWNE